MNEIFLLNAFNIAILNHVELVVDRCGNKIQPEVQELPVIWNAVPLIG